jgi:tetratricopeptide (TPR) repeat protein
MTRRYICLFLLAAIPLYGQTLPGKSLSAEMQNLEKIIADTAVPAVQRYNALSSLASLCQLSGNNEAAAKHWLSAAAVIPNEDALLSAAVCFAATGNWERARAVLEPVLHISKRARFLELGINAQTTGGAEKLLSIAQNKDYADIMSEIYFMLWKVSKDAAWKQRLLAEFPKSPEAAGIDKPGLFWLFPQARDTFSAMEMALVKTAKPIQPAQPVQLQTGVFGKEENAQAHIASLRKSGYAPIVEARVINGTQMWLVFVPAGADVNMSIKELRDKGYDNFPVK